MTRVSDDATTPQPQQLPKGSSFLPTLRLGLEDKSFISSERSFSVRNNANRIFKTAQTSSKRSPQSITPDKVNQSHYAQGAIPTENLKFSQFLDIIFNSKLTMKEIKSETRDYV